MSHAQHAMHPHSLRAYREERPALQQQKREMDGHSGHAGCEVGPDNDGPEAA